MGRIERISAAPASRATAAGVIRIPRPAGRRPSPRTSLARAAR